MANDGCQKQFNVLMAKWIDLTQGRETKELVRGRLLCNYFTRQMCVYIPNVCVCVGGEHLKSK